MNGPRGESYHRILEFFTAGRDETPYGVGAFITGSVFSIDGGIASAYWYGELAPKVE